MARGRAIVARLARSRPGNLAADGEERPLTSPDRNATSPLAPTPTLRLSIRSIWLKQEQGTSPPKAGDGIAPDDELVTRGSTSMTGACPACGGTGRIRARRPT